MNEGSEDKSPALYAAFMRAVSKKLSESGSTLDDLAHRLGSSTISEWQDGSLVELPDLAEIFDTAASLTDDDCFGLHVAAELDPRDLGVLGYVGIASRTLGEALHNLARYHAVTRGPARFEVETIGKETRITRYLRDHRLAAHRQANEFVAATLIQCYRFFTQRAVRPLEVQFVHMRRKYQKDVAAFFGSHVAYGSDRNVITLRSCDLEIPISTADSRLLRVLQQHCEDILATHKEMPTDLRQRVEMAVAESLSRGPCKIEQVARALGLSSRTLSRRLADLGTSFGAIVDGLRRELGTRYVGSKDVTLSEAAFLLGYSDPSAFNHAFKRWTGQSPRAYRAAGAQLSSQSP